VPINHSIGPSGSSKERRVFFNHFVCNSKLNKEKAAANSPILDKPKLVGNELDSLVSVRQAGNFRPTMLSLVPAMAAIGNPSL